jgi:hypothetical protein
LVVDPEISKTEIFNYIATQGSMHFDEHNNQPWIEAAALKNYLQLVE